MDMPKLSRPTAGCQGVNDILSLVGDKWTVQVVIALLERPRRFNDLKRQVDGISQQMLTRTLKALERNGMVDRAVRATTPPQVDYSLTALGLSLSKAVRHLADWAVAHRANIRENRRRYEAGAGSEQP